MMIFASSGQCFCYFIITILIRYSEKPGYPHAKEVASGSVAFFFLYYVFFGIGMQGVPWLYPTEINTLSMRTKGAALGTATNWIFNFMVREGRCVGVVCTDMFHRSSRLRPSASRICIGSSTSFGLSSISASFRVSISSTPRQQGVLSKYTCPSLLSFIR